ncbi:MAG TPA: FtsX-like permease family protein, partial [Chthoniobacterales bacterium]|nr:FtsX-like permease family protein [Chthoniobacterales bacterium]
PVQKEVSRLDPDLPVVSVLTMDEVMSRGTSQRRASLLLLGLFAGLATVLAAIGLYGLLAYSIRQRTSELGIRIALGARERHVMSAAVGRPIVLLGIGSLVGLLCGIFASRLLAQIVYQANPRDPVVVAGAMLTMTLLGLVASAIPALRARAVDPARLLREE